MELPKQKNYLSLRLDFNLFPTENLLQFTDSQLFLP